MAEHVGRGQLSREKVLRTAVELIDSHGLAALSMRRLGESMGVEAMSLYRYIKGKDDLLNAVHGAILEEMAPPSSSGAWHQRLRGMAESFRDVLRQHPHALPLFASRPAVTPSSLRAVEASLAVLAEAGFSPAEQLHAFHSLVGFVVGTAALHFGLADDAQASAGFDPLHYPHLTRSVVQLSSDLDEEFRFGLDVFLVGLQAQARKRGRRRMR